MGGCARAQSQKLLDGRETLTLEASLADPGALGERVVLVDHLGTWSVASVAEYLADLGKKVWIVVPPECWLEDKYL